MSILNCYVDIDPP